MKTCLLAMPRRTPIRVLASVLGERYRVEVEGERLIRRTYLDTFDRRMLARGTVLELLETGTRARLRWRALGSGQILGEQRVAEAPCCARDLGPLKFRTRIEAVIGIRALLPIAKLRSRVTRLDLRDGDEKRVLGIEIQQDRAYDAEQQHEPAKMGAKRMQLLPMRGYERTLVSVRDKLIDACKLAPLDEDPLFAAFEILGTEQAALEPAARIEPTERADIAVKAMLRHLIDVIEFNEPGVRENVDSECLHDFRVAVRRTRTLFGQIKETFPADSADRFSEDFVWLGAVTGPTRDMDVYLLSFEGFKALLPAAERDDLEPLREYLERHQRIERQALMRALDSTRYSRLKREWRAFLAAPSPCPGPPNAARPIVDVGRERIARVYRKAAKAGRALTPETPAADFHELRKTCKKLRYLLEFFNGLHPNAPLKKLLKELKLLQDRLGAFQDLQVQRNSLSRYRADMLSEGVLTPGCDNAIGALIESLASHEREIEQDCIGAWERFTRCACRNAYRELLRSPQRATTVA